MACSITSARKHEELRRHSLEIYSPDRNGIKRCLQCRCIIHAELLLIHPFREGNGRLARWLADIMFFQAGFPIPYYNISSRALEKKYIEAVANGYQEEYDDLINFLERVVKASRA